MGCIAFPSTNKENPVSDSRPSMHATVSEEMEPQPFSNNSDPDIQEDIPNPNPIPKVTSKVDISLVNAVAYIRACKLPGTQQFTLNIKDITARSNSTSDSAPLDLSSVLEEYHDFADVFDKAKADTLAQH